MTECVSYWHKDIDNFWHAQSSVMFFGQREPVRLSRSLLRYYQTRALTIPPTGRRQLHIMCLYPGFIYTASVAVARLNITERCEAAAMGLFVLIFDMPYDIIGIKNLWWTWVSVSLSILQLSLLPDDEVFC